MSLTIYKILLATTGISIVGGAVVSGYFTYGSIFKSAENPQTSIEDIDAPVEVEADDITPVEELDARKEEESRLLSIALADAVATKKASLDLANKEKDAWETTISASTLKVAELNRRVSTQTKIINDNTQTSKALATSLQEANERLPHLKEAAKQALQALTKANTQLTKAKSANTSAQGAWTTQQTKLTGLTTATTQALSAKNGNATQLANLQGQYDATSVRRDGQKRRSLTPQITSLRKKTTGLENTYQRANTAAQRAKEVLDRLQTAKLQKEKEEKDAQSKFDLATNAKSDADATKSALQTNITDYTNKKKQIDKTIQTATAAKTKLQEEIDAENKAKTDAEEKRAVKVNLIATLTTELTELKEKIKTAE